MIKFLANFIGNLLELLNKIFNLIKKKEFKCFLISKLKSKFYIPSSLSRKRIEKKISKEPGTIEWINNYSRGSTLTIRGGD